MERIRSDVSLSEVQHEVEMVWTRATEEGGTRREKDVDDETSGKKEKRKTKEEIHGCHMRERELLE